MGHTWKLHFSDACSTDKNSVAIPNNKEGRGIYFSQKHIKKKWTVAAWNIHCSGLLQQSA